MTTTGADQAGPVAGRAMVLVDRAVPVVIVVAAAVQAVGSGAGLRGRVKFSPIFYRSG